MKEGIAFSEDSPLQLEMEDAFEYIETPDQIKAINDIKVDMENSTKEKKKVKQTDIESKLPAGLESAVKETAKYAVKSADYLTDDDDENRVIVQDLEKGLHRKRMVGWGGLIKNLRRDFSKE